MALIKLEELDGALATRQIISRLRHIWVALLLISGFLRRDDGLRAGYLCVRSRAADKMMAYTV